MAKPNSHIKENLSSAFVKAVVAKAGHSLTITYEEDYGVDGIIHCIEQINGKYQPTGPQFNFQLKATITCNTSDDSISYSIDPDAYNKFVCWDHPMPMVLIVFCMPRDKALWCNITEDDGLVLKNCAYWKIMNVAELVKSKKVIHLSRTDIFDENAVSKLLGIAQRAIRGNIKFY